MVGFSLYALKYVRQELICDRHGRLNPDPSTQSFLSVQSATWDCSSRFGHGSHSVKRH